MIKKIILYICLALIPNYAYLQENGEDLYQEAISEEKSLEQNLHDLYAHNALNKDNVTKILKLYDFYDIDELLYVLNKAKTHLNAKVSSLKTARYTVPLLMAGMGLFLSMDTLTAFVNKLKIYANPGVMPLGASSTPRQTQYQLPKTPQSPLNPNDPYTILGIKPGATQEEIKAAYKGQAMKWHPDRNKGNEENAAEQFKKIGEAYEALKPKDPIFLVDFFNKYSPIAGLGSFMMIPFVFNSYNKNITQQNTQLKMINDIIQQLEMIQEEETGY